MATLRDIITAALEHLGVAAPGETVAAEDLTLGRRRLTSMLDRWSADDLAVYAATQEQFPLTGATQYTIGPGGDFDTVRPTAVLPSSYVLSGTRSYALELINDDQYAQIALKDQGGMPSLWWFDPQFPLGILRFWPVISGMTLVLRSTKPLASYSDFSADVVLPPGYQEAIETNLALAMAPSYGRPVPPGVQALAGSGYYLISRANGPDMRLGMPAALLARWGSFEIEGG